MLCKKNLIHLETIESNESAFHPMFEPFDNPDSNDMRGDTPLAHSNFDFRIYLQELFSFWRPKKGKLTFM